MSPRVRPVISFLRRALGWVLLLLGILYLIFSSLIIRGLGTFYTAAREQLTDHISRGGIAGPFVLGTVLFLCGLILLEGKKRSILFLRPFNSISNKKTIKAFSKKLGRNFTIVALDDGAISPPVLSLTKVFVVAPMFALTSLVLFFVGALLMPAYEERSVSSRVPTMLCISAGILLMRLAWRNLTQKSERRGIDDAKTLGQAVFRARAFTTWGLRIFVPRILVVRTADHMWKQAVSELGRITDIALIDISRRSDNIEWELAFLRQEKPGKTLVIASDDAGQTHEVELGGVERYQESVSSDAEFERRIRRRIESLVRKSPEEETA